MDVRAFLIPSFATLPCLFFGLGCDIVAFLFWLARLGFDGRIRTGLWILRMGRL